ncbi:hypothetical protein HNP33_003242 [Comamonas odontotermitis]|uniref:Secreted protein n=1 Tax=Comamonas odontotermitis TaxID=379895 RepID=A0ABR6RIZ8_9BURK|nr:hypothetical protein [Comamonas odontotermitis]MBB6579132.1 hypothetical protein [Comamonas odontotermitis]
MALALFNTDMRVRFAAPTTLSNSLWRLLVAWMASEATSLVVSINTFCAKAMCVPPHSSMAVSISLIKRIEFRMVFL